jgi:O-antigen ligase
MPEKALGSNSKEIIVLLLAIPAALLAGIMASSNIILMMAMVVGSGALLLILKDPAWGVMFIVAQLSVEALLIIRMSGFTKMPLMLGVVTAFIYLTTRKKKQGVSLGHVSPLLAFAALFAAWVVARSANNMQTMSTYIQLIILMFLAGELITPEKQHRFMILFVLGTVIGAVYYSYQIQQFGISGATENTGLNRNTAAFYFAVALIMAIYLHQQSRARWANIAFPLAYLILGRGIIFTESRAGLANLIVIVGIVIGVWPILLKKPSSLTERGSHTRQGIAILFLALSLAFIVQFVISNEYITYMSQRLFNPAETDVTQIDQGRTELVRQGWNTFLQNPVAGVGVSQFQSRDVRSIKLKQGLTVHNLYIVLLAETGIIGFIFFMGWVVLAIFYFFDAFRRGDPHYRSLALTWLTIMVIILIRGVSASTLHYDKLFWSLGGVSIAFRRVTVGTP